MPTSWYTLGEAFIRQVQSSANPVLDVLFTVGSFLGEEYFYLLLLPFLYWCVDKSLGRWTAYALLLSAYVNNALKYVWNTPRPPEALWRNVLRPESPGFPSGHAQTSLVVWGTIAARLKRAWAWVLALVLVTVISFSRLYNGVHYPHDVVGGLLFGAVMLWVFLRVAPRVGARVASWSAARVAVVAGVVAVGFVLVHPPAFGLWPAEGAVTAFATLWGMSVGFVLERDRVNFHAGGPWYRRAARFVVGMVVVGLVYVGMKLAAPADVAYPVAVLIRTVRYGLVGLLIAWGAPALFVRLRIG